VGRSAEPTRRFPRREAAAQRTRTALVTAAAELFIERGYAAATIAAIAARAGVARPTVFTSVPGGKPQLLKLARDMAIAGDDEAVPVPERDWFHDAMAQADPAELLRRQAGNYRRILDRAAALELVLTTAAAIDAELRPLLEQARAQRAAGTRLVTRRLVELGTVRPEQAEAAADTIYALASPEVYTLLVRDRAWSADNYQQWLAEKLITALVPGRRHDNS
jgi:AcrR family transcriptional regulator